MNLFGYELGNIAVGGDSILFWSWMILLSLLIGVVVGVAIWLLYDWLRHDIKVEIIQQVGKPYFVDVMDEDGKLIERKHVANFETIEKPGRMYNKKVDKGTTQEWFKIKGSDYNRINIFDSVFFYNRTKRGVFDIMRKGIKLYNHPERGLCPVPFANPSFEVSPLSMNTVISAYVNTNKIIEEKYNSDFWAKYGTLITVSFIIGAIVISSIMQMKIQESNWERHMTMVRETFNAMKGVISPNLP